MTAATSNPSLLQLLAAPVKLPIGDIVLEIQPMSWTVGARAIEHLLPAMGMLPLGTDAAETKGEQLARWAAVIITFRSEVAAFAAEASGLPIEHINALQPAHMIELVSGLVEINLDFFVLSLPGAAKRVAGRLVQMSERLAPLLAALAEAEPGSGSTTSSSA